MHLRLLMAQALIFAVNRGIDLTEINNLHLVTFSIVSVLGPLPSLSSCLEIFRCASACVAWCSTRTTPIALPENLGELAMPAHPSKGAEMKSFDALRSHPWSAWMRTTFGAATTGLEDVITSAEIMFVKPYGPQEQIILNWLRDGQVVIRNVLLFLHLSSQPQTPAIPPTIATPAPGTPDLWGE